MSVRKNNEKQKRKAERIQAGNVLAAVSPAPSREELAQLVIQHIETRILDIEKSLIQIERMLLNRRWRGLIAGLASR